MYKEAIYKNSSTIAKPSLALWKVSYVVRRTYARLARLGVRNSLLLPDKRTKWRYGKLYRVLLSEDRRLIEVLSFICTGKFFKVTLPLIDSAAFFTSVFLN